MGVLDKFVKKRQMRPAIHIELLDLRTVLTVRSCPEGYFLDGDEPRAFEVDIDEIFELMSLLGLQLPETYSKEHFSVRYGFSEEINVSHLQARVDGDMLVICFASNEPKDVPLEAIDPSFRDELTYRGKFVVWWEEEEA